MRNTLLIYHDLIEGIVAAMDARAPYTVRNSGLVCEIAQRIFHMMKLSKRKIQMIYIAAHVHDIGKIGVPN